MKLPFSHEQFLDVFAAYNRLLWPVAVLLWLATLMALVSWWRRGAASSPVLAGLLAIHWAWAGIAYHFAFFRAINPAAIAFATVFVAQAVLLAWTGVLRRRLVFSPSRSGWGLFGVALAVYALAYPGMGLLTGLSYPRMPTFGVPCPTTILTAGLLLTAPRAGARLAAVVPMLWSAVGGSAAFTLRIRPDFALPVAGAALLLHLLPARASAPPPAPSPRAGTRRC
ncbi:MAG TPA: DUF6064 family protein [Verrucomicrobiae bacterium]|jgi:hypothetical protein|nr:DUF6064 family protein [Verrucomicrobiae bacterium]